MNFCLEAECNHRQTGQKACLHITLCNSSLYLKVRRGHLRGLVSFASFTSRCPLLFDVFTLKSAGGEGPSAFVYPSWPNDK